MPISAFTPREVIGLSQKADSLIHSVMIRINEQLREKSQSFIHGQFRIEIDLREFKNLYHEVEGEEKTSFFLILRSEYIRMGWHDLILHERDATGAKCFAVTLSM